MTFAPLVVVTATTEVIRDVSRVRVNEAYTNALAAAGLVPLILPPMDPAVAVSSLAAASGLVLTGGEDIDPARFGQVPHDAAGTPHGLRDQYEIALALAALERRIPTLAICRGAQVVNVALGGTLVQDIPSQRPSVTEHNPAGRRAERVHQVEIERGSRLAAAVGAVSITTNSSHHQSVDAVGSGLTVAGKSTDGIVEALEPIDSTWWMLAVQWHPEELTTTGENWDRRLFAAFADAVRASGNR